MASKSSTTPDYTISQDDPRLKAVTTEETKYVSGLDKTYGDMIEGSDKFYQDQIDAAEDYAEEQTKLQNEALDLTIQGIEQNKAELAEDYTKEQSGAYVDWQKQSGQYGVNAEKMAASGLAGSGYSESSQVSMYNTYQNRVATARQTYTRAVADYNLAIAEARNQNSAILAEIAYNALKTKLELSLEGFQYKNTLVLDKVSKTMEAKKFYSDKYFNTLNQINTENALKEEVRQFGLNYDLEVKKYKESIRQFDEEIARLKAKDKNEYALEIKKLEADKKKVQQEYKMWQEEMKLKKAQFAEDKRQFNVTQKSKSSGSSSSSSSKKPSSSTKSTKQTKEPVQAKKPEENKPKTSTESAYAYLNKLISSGASKDKVSNEIAIALREGAITKAQAAQLRKTFTPRGYTY